MTVVISMKPEITRKPNKMVVHVFHLHFAALASFNQASQLRDFSYEPVTLGFAVNVDVHRHTTVAATEVGADGGASVFGEAAGSGVAGSHFVCICRAFGEFSCVFGLMSFVLAFFRFASGNL